MTTSPSKFVDELTRRVDEVLHYMWDPIGISDEPLARHEYGSYGPRVMSLLMADADAAQLGSHLDQIAIQNMGLSSNLEQSIHVAKVLIAWRETLQGRHA